MDLLLFFLPGPIVYLVMGVLPKTRVLAVCAALGALGVVGLHTILPALTGSDAAGNGMASGYRAIGYYSLASGLLFAGAYMLVHHEWQLAERPRLLRWLVFCVGLIGATLSFLLVLS